MFLRNQPKNNHVGWIKELVIKTVYYYFDYGFIQHICCRINNKKLKVFTNKNIGKREYCNN